MFGTGGAEAAASAPSALGIELCQSMGAAAKYVQAENTVLTKPALLNSSSSAHHGGDDTNMKRIRTFYVYRGILW